MKNTHKFLIQALLWLITVNPILTIFPSFQFARLDPSVAYQNRSQIQVQPIFYTSCISRKQQELYEKMILTHVQHQEYLKAKNQEPRFILNLKNKEQQKILTQNWKQELVKAEQTADTEQATRLTRRLQAIAQTIPANNIGLNSELESCLLYEFKESYLAAKQLEQQFPALPHLKTVAPFIYDCAEAATQQTDILQAFKYSDLAHNVLTICTKAATFIGKVATAVGKGVVKGATQSAHNLYQLTKPDHWNVQFDFDDGDFVHPSTAVGRSGQKKVQKFLEKRKPTVIYGRKYSAQAIERMQERGFTPTIIEHSIEYGIPHPFPKPKKINLYETENEIEVIINSETKNVISVFHISEEAAIEKGYNVIKKKSEQRNI